jgi:Acyl-CoA dehydrogenase, C-terminal domain
VSPSEHERRAFAESVAAAAGRALAGRAVAWRPGEPGDDRFAGLAAALARIGWPALAEDPELLALAAPAALELGRLLAPLDVVDALLGGPLRAGELVRYGGTGRAVRPAGDAIVAYRVELERPVAYADALGVYRIERAVQDGALTGPAARARIAAWTAASAGYAAGVGAWALELAVDYARGRRAFGTTLSGLAPVQQLLADAATTVRGLVLLAADEPGPDALAHAGPALCAVTSACQQVLGAIGYTLEFPLQRAYRRARALALWADSALDALASPSAA